MNGENGTRFRFARAKASSADARAASRCMTAQWLEARRATF